MNANLAAMFARASRSADRSAYAPVKDRGQMPPALAFMTAAACAKEEDQDAIERVRVAGLLLAREAGIVGRRARLEYLESKAK